MGEKEPEVDIIQKSIGSIGKWQLFVCFAIFLVKFPVAWHQLSVIFLAPAVDFSCADNATDKCSKNCTEHVFDRSIFTETIISEWDLVCERTQLANVAQTVFMLGILSGSFLFGLLADRFGRRGPLFFAVILQVLSGTGAGFSPWFWLFLIMRFLTALATGGTMVTSFVLVMELIGKKWRTTVGVVYQIPFNLGHLTMAGIAYLVRDWRHFQMCITLPSLLLLSYYWVLPESPRWLMAVGKTDEAVKILEKAASTNSLPKTQIRNEVTEFVTTKTPDETKTGSVLDLFRTPVLRWRTLNICFNWTVCGLCFFGVAQYIGQFGGNIFINVAISAAIQVPGTLLSIYLMQHWGRKLALIVSHVVSGLSCLIIPLLPLMTNDTVWPKTVLGSIGMLGLSTSFPIVYIYSGELFPTVVRNVGVGLSSMCARIGSMLAPFVAGLTVINGWTSPIIFGVFPLVGAFLCLKLPETLNCELPDSIQDAIDFGKSKAEKDLKNGIKNNGFIQESQLD